MGGNSNRAHSHRLAAARAQRASRGEHPGPSGEPSRSVSSSADGVVPEEPDEREIDRSKSVALALESLSDGKPGEHVARLRLVRKRADLDVGHRHRELHASSNADATRDARRKGDEHGARLLHELHTRIACGTNPPHRNAAS